MTSFNTHPKQIVDVNGHLTTRHVSNNKGKTVNSRVASIKVSKHSAEALPTSLLHRAIRNTPLKEMNSSLLAAAIENEIPSEKIAEAIALASLLHRHATRGSRGKQPREEYVCHPLRNTLRLTRLGCFVEDIAIGSILHDTVEDCADEIINIHFPELDFSNWDEKTKQDFVISEVIEPQFGARVAKILKGVTNPPMPEGITKKEKNKIYFEHVVEEIFDEDVFLVKLQDWADNAGSLHHHFEEKTNMVIGMSNKYLPLAEVFLKRLGTVEQISEESKELMRINIIEIQNRLTSFAAQPLIR